MVERAPPHHHVYISQVLLMTVSFLVVHGPTARKRNRFNKQNNSKKSQIRTHAMLAPAARHNNTIIAKRPIEERYKIVAK